MSETARAGAGLWMGAQRLKQQLRREYLPIMTFIATLYIFGNYTIWKLFLLNTFLYIFNAFSPHFSP